MLFIVFYDMQTIHKLLSINIIADTYLIKYRNHANFKKNSPPYHYSS